MKLQLREWLAELSARERALVLAAATVVVLTVLFLAIWEPIFNGVRSTETEIIELQNLVGRLAAVQGQSGGGAAAAIQGRGNSLLSVVDQTVKQAGLAETVKRMQPEGESTVRIWLEAADYATLARWLGTLNTVYGVQVTDAILNREAQTGQVRARLDLVRAPS
jgi:general secretion pathway protein M